MRQNLLKLAKLRRDESGAAAVEFAIVSTAFIVFIFGIAYSAIMLHTRATLQWAVEATARDAALDPDATPTQMSTKVNNHLSGFSMPAAEVSYSTATVGTVQVATLTASMNRSFTIPLVGTFSHTYSATAKIPQNDDE